MASSTLAYNDFYDWSPRGLLRGGGTYSTKTTARPNLRAYESERAGGTFRRIGRSNNTNVGEIVVQDAENELALSGPSQDYTLAAIRGFATLPAGWEGDASLAPSEEIVNDALAVARSWPMELGELAAEPDTDGHISLSGFDQKGMISVAIDLIGGGTATYAVLSGATILTAGKFDPRNQTAILQVFDQARQHLSRVS
ncbi:MAG: hypothetical protein KL839_04010 [Rhizobium sp.]|nr:hypothetical protein [Rhizobium sp.]